MLGVLQNESLYCMDMIDIFSPSNNVIQKQGSECLRVKNLCPELTSKDGGRLPTNMKATNLIISTKLLQKVQGKVHCQSSFNSEPPPPQGASSLFPNCPTTPTERGDSGKTTALCAKTAI